MVSPVLRRLSLGCAVWLTATVNTLGSFQSDAARSPNAFEILIDGWGPHTLDEELKIARFLRTITETFFGTVASLDTEGFAKDPQYDEETAEKLALTVSDLKISLREMTATLDLIERTAEKGPGDYAQSAPSLWLTVIKDISLEKDNARRLEEIGLYTSNWPELAEASLPRLFSRILEPKLAELLRDRE